MEGLESSFPVPQKKKLALLEQEALELDLQSQDLLAFQRPSPAKLNEPQNLLEMPPLCSSGLDSIAVTQQHTYSNHHTPGSIISHAGNVFQEYHNGPSYPTAGDNNQGQVVGHGVMDNSFHNTINNIQAGQSCPKASFHTFAKSLQYQPLDLRLSLP